MSFPKKRTICVDRPVAEKTLARTGIAGIFRAVPATVGIFSILGSGVMSACRSDSTVSTALVLIGARSLLKGWILMENYCGKVVIKPPYGKATTNRFIHVGVLSPCDVQDVATKAIIESFSSSVPHIIPSILLNAFAEALSQIRAQDEIKSEVIKHLSIYNNKLLEELHHVFFNTLENRKEKELADFVSTRAALFENKCPGFTERVCKGFGLRQIQIKKHYSKLLISNCGFFDYDNKGTLNIYKPTWIFPQNARVKHKNYCTYKFQDLYDFVPPKELITNHDRYEIAISFVPLEQVDNQYAVDAVSEARQLLSQTPKDFIIKVPVKIGRKDHEFYDIDIARYTRKLLYHLCISANKQRLFYEEISKPQCNVTISHSTRKSQNRQPQRNKKKAGAKGLSDNDKARRWEVIDDWKNAKSNGITMKEYVKDNNMTVSELNRAVNWGTQQKKRQNTR